MVDVLEVGDVRLLIADKPGHFPPGLEIIHELCRDAHLRKRSVFLVAGKVKTLREVLRLWRRQVVRVLHRENDDLVALAFEELFPREHVAFGTPERVI